MEISSPPHAHSPGTRHIAAQPQNAPATPYVEPVIGPVSARVSFLQLVTSNVGMVVSLVSFAILVLALVDVAFLIPHVVPEVSAEVVVPLQLFAATWALCHPLLPLLHLCAAVGAVFVKRV
jgi:hypothetical protein